SILDPDLEDSAEAVMNAVQRSLLWNFWPKMVKYENRGSSMKFKTLLQGKDQVLPTPEECPPLDIFAAAIRSIKEGQGTDISCRKPRKHLGEMAIIKEPKGLRLPGFGPQNDDDMFPEASCHVALMRPAELVVKYLEGNRLPPSAEWGGAISVR
ncbi:hypothetical protein N9H37_03315, partial [Congregibacter sp.]